MKWGRREHDSGKRMMTLLALLACAGIALGLSPWGTGWRLRHMDTSALSVHVAHVPGDAAAQEEWAQRLEAQGLDDGAMAVYVQAARTRPGQAQDWRKAAQIALRRGDGEQAQRFATEAVRAQPNDALAHLTQADVQERAGAWVLARQSYRMAVDLDSHSLSAWRGLAQTSLETKDFAAAAQAASKAIGLAPGDAQSWLLRGRALRLDGRETQALPVLNAARRLAPNDASVLLECGLLYLQNGSQDALQEAEQMFRQAQVLSAGSSNAYQPTYQLGMAYLAQTRYADAEAQLQAALRLRPNEEAVLFGLMRAYSFQGKHAQAQAVERRFEQARGNSLAISQLQMRLGREPNRVDLLSRLAALYKATGDTMRSQEIQAQLKDRQK